MGNEVKRPMLVTGHGTYVGYPQVETDAYMASLESHIDELTSELREAVQLFEVWVLSFHMGTYPSIMEMNKSVDLVERFSGDQSLGGAQQDTKEDTR